MADEICELMDLPVSGCVHCRDTGRYVVPEGAQGSGLSARDTDEVELKIDPDGSVWVQGGGDIGEAEWLAADEAFQRGKFGRGRPR